MSVAPPHHSSIARALGPVAATMRAALAEVGAPLGPPRLVVVAVSGGADSMATLGLLELLRRRLAIELVVAHLDHGLRAGSRAEAELVVATARARGLRCWHRRLCIDAGPGVPARAREARREALLDAAHEVGADLVVLGHTLTDQVETVLLHLCRGAGLDGLAGMRPWQAWVKPDGAARRRPAQGLWVRPMMQLTRDETRGLAARLGLAFVDDPGNDDRSQPRVRLRQDVLPALVEINAGALGHIGATARIVRAAAQAVGQGTPPADPGSIRAMRTLPELGRRAAILELCRGAGIPADAVAARTLDAIVAALAHDVPRRWDLHGAVLHIDGVRVWIASSTPQPLTHPMPAAILPAPGRNA